MLRHADGDSDIAEDRIDPPPADLAGEELWHISESPGMDHCRLHAPQPMKVSAVAKW
jgi:hypothetical protein